MPFYAGAVLLATLVILILVEWWMRRTTEGKERPYRKKAKKELLEVQGRWYGKVFLEYK